MELRHRRRAFVSSPLALRLAKYRAYGLDRSASIANSYSELRHQLLGWIRGSLFYWHIAPAIPTAGFAKVWLHSAWVKRA